MTTLGDALRSAGFDVVDSPVAARTSTWRGVSWVMVHHTAGSDSASAAANEASFIKTGGDSPPLAQLMVGLDQRVYVCAYPSKGQAEPGRASHAGTGSYPGIPDDAANEVALGIEVQCNGTHTIASAHPAVYGLLIDLIGFLCDRYGFGANHVIGHKEWAPDRKVDPRDNMDTVRADVARVLNSGTSGGDDEVNDADLNAIADKVWNRFKVYLDNGQLGPAYGSAMSTMYQAADKIESGAVAVDTSSKVWNRFAVYESDGDIGPSFGQAMSTIYQAAVETIGGVAAMSASAHPVAETPTDADDDESEGDDDATPTP